MTEYFRDEELPRHGAAIDGDELALSPAKAMDMTSHQILAGPGLSGDENGHTERDGVRKTGESSPERAVIADEVRQALPRQ